MLLRVPGIDRGSGDGIEADASEGQLDGVGLADDDGAEAPQRADEEAFALPVRGEFALGAGPDGETFNAVEVLYRYRDAGQRAWVLAAGHDVVDGLGLAERTFGVEDDVGSEGAGLVAGDGGFHQGAGGGRAATDSGGCGGDGRTGHGAVSLSGLRGWVGFGAPGKGNAMCGYNIGQRIH